MEIEHVSRKFAAELKTIRFKLLEMGGKVEVMIREAMKALVNRDSTLADQVLLADKEVNKLEVIIDEKCLEVLATQQPAARDLRFVTLAMKTVTDLERIGDSCTNISKRAKELNAEPPLKPYIDLPRMAEWAAMMVKEALDAFVSGDENLARKVIADDDFLDNLDEQIQRELSTYVMADPQNYNRVIKISRISRALERIGDHATNVAEMVIFMLKGKDIRHT